VAGGLLARHGCVPLRGCVEEQGEAPGVMKGGLQEVWVEITASRKKSLRNSKPSPNALDVSGEGYKLFSFLFHLAKFLCVFSTLKVIILVYILIKNVFFEHKKILLFCEAFCIEGGHTILPQSSWLEVP